MGSHGRARVLGTSLAVLALCACDSSGGDSDVDTDIDTDTDTDADCADGEASCLADARTLRTCVQGSWQDMDCLAETGGYCEAGTCKDRWLLGDPQWSDCPGVDHATPESLADKAAHYDRLVRETHVHPRHQLMVAVRIADGTNETAATYQDVTRWHTGENDGLWTGAYLASQAFRYAVTRGTAQGEEALDNIRTVLQGNERQMAITGVPGLYTREYRTPDIDGMSCPEDISSYRRDPEKDDNRWLQIRDDGCVWLANEEGTEWVQSEHCGYPAELHDYCWLDNVSQDEYSGHFLAMGAIWKLVDDADLKARVVALAEQAVAHLIKNDLTYVDWDGRTTEHGRLYALAGDDTPGFNAMLALSWVKVGAALTGRADFDDFYHRCLLQRDGPDECQPQAMGLLKPYTEWLDTTLLHVSSTSCKNNWNNFNMFYMALFNLLWFETDPAVLEAVWAYLEPSFFDPEDNERPLSEQKNSFFNFIYAAMKDQGPESSGPAYSEVEDAVCTLKQFPASQAPFDADTTTDEYPHDCDSRLDHSMTAEVIPIYLRCPGSFAWTRNPYSRKICTADPTLLNTPGDYLLAYWMGRYFGFIGEAL